MPLGIFLVILWKTEEEEKKQQKNTSLKQYICIFNALLSLSSILYYNLKIEHLNCLSY